MICLWCKARRSLEHCHLDFADAGAPWKVRFGNEIAACSFPIRISLSVLLPGGRRMEVIIYIHPDLNDVDIVPSGKLMEPDPRDGLQFNLDADQPWLADAPSFSVIPYHYDYGKTATDAKVTYRPRD